jgi:hypothetical protein
LAELKKRALHIEILIAQIDCLLILYHNQTIPTNLITKYQSSLIDNKRAWITLCKEDLYEVVERSIKHRPHTWTSDAFAALLLYVKSEIRDSDYHSLVEKYPALEQLIETIQEHEISSWIAKCTRCMIDKTIHDQKPVFEGMAMAVTKVLDKMERRITTTRGIGKYQDDFVDFLVVLMSISSLAVKWITTNIAGPSIRFFRKVHSNTTSSINILGLNTKEYETMITTWRAAFNYTGPILCAKDQTKVSEMIEVN